MIRNYLKIAFRNLLKNKSYSFINIVGLTAGTACCLYILLYVMEQYSYDRHQQGLERMYRVVTDIRAADGSGDTYSTALLSPPIAPAIAQEFPEVELAARLVNPPDITEHVLRWQDKAYFETRGYYVDSTFFRLFTYKWLSGNAEHALDEPYTVVLTKPVAERIFGSQDAIGQTIRISNRFGDDDFKVTGVVDPAAAKSHIRGHLYLSMNSGGIGEYVRTSNHWAGNNFISGYIKLKPRADAKALEAKLPAFLQKHGAEQLKELGMKKTLSLEPVKDIHLHSNRINQLETTVSARLLYILLTIAGFIQLIACINFMNLATARSTRRAKEVGIRKAIGANRGALVQQFLGESMVLACIAILLAAPLVKLAMPYLNQLTGSEVSAAFSQHRGIWLAVGGLVLFTGLLSGSYPAFYLSAFKAVQVLKGGMQNAGSAARLRKGLVVFQFAISIGLVLSAIVIVRQLSYMQHKDLGFQKEQKVIIPFRTETARAQLTAYKNEVLKLPGVASASAALSVPGQFITQDFGLYTEGKDMNSARIVQIVRTDGDYLEALHIPLLAGRVFTPADTTVQVIMNEQALKALDIPQEEALGKQVFSDWSGERFSFEIIGVMRDYHFRTLRSELSPLMLRCSPPNELQNLIIDATTSDYAALMPGLEEAWSRLVPGLPFEHFFLDENLQQQYEAEASLANIIKAFTIIAILISCLGLFGLSAFTAEQRTKEIGIRKVLGASVENLASLLAKDFLRLTVLSAIVALPLAWYAMNRWLTDFAYRTSIEWWMFALAGAIALAVAFLTVSFQSIKAALANPMESLRSE
ncbi:MAG: ABC transporter permease [Phaeodactylibacter sp.]|nr:ABC transporter permease [Phaeodactylibacter sp.]